MKTTPVTPADLAASVWAVPPLARNADLTLNHAANQAQIDHLQAGGVRTLMYGSNANFYNIGTTEYPSILDMLEKYAAKDTWVIPSMGSDFGKAFDQISILRALKAKDYATAAKIRETYLPLEDARDAINPIRTLHEAVTLAGIADMGPMLPTLSNIEARHVAGVREAALTLLAHDRALGM